MSDFIFHPIVRIGLAILFSISVWTGNAYANHQVDEIEAALSAAVGAAVESRLSDALSEENQAYAYFLLAVYRHDSGAREKSEALYERLHTAESGAFLGSIEMLKARDGSGGFFKLLKKKKMVERGIEKLDADVEAYPDDPKVRIVRAITYLGLPAFFGKFEAGFSDIELILREMEAGTISVPREEPFFRDRISLYYYAGRYFLRKDETKKAREMFSRAAESAPDNPFAAAAKKRLAALL
jgi:tetratricopeptide (TPR) repeat protein